METLNADFLNEVTSDLIKNVKKQKELAFEKIMPNYKQLDANDFRKVVFNGSLEHFYYKKRYIGSTKTIIKTPYVGVSCELFTDEEIVFFYENTPERW